MQVKITFLNAYAASLITSPFGSFHCGCVTSAGSGASAWQVSTTDLPTATVCCFCTGYIFSVCAEHPVKNEIVKACVM